MTNRPTPEDIDLLAQLIDLRDSAHLAGHRDDVFNLLQFQGTQSVLVGPGRTGRISVSTMAMRRLQDLGLFRVINVREKGLTFDLGDDVRDRLEEMRVSVGQPSRMGELQAAKEQAEAAIERAEAAQRDLEASVEAAAAKRAERRHAFARRVGRRVRRAATVALGAIYLGVVLISGYFVASNLPPLAVVAIVSVAVALAVLGWLRHIDGFSLAAGIESRVVKRITAWLESFDAPRT